MKAVGEEYEALIQSHLRADEMRIPMYSTLTGKPISDSGTPHARYWRENLESPVLFSTAVKETLKEKDQTRMLFIEFGPHSALSGPLRQIMREARVDFTQLPDYCQTNKPAGGPARYIRPSLSPRCTGAIRRRQWHRKHFERYPFIPMAKRRHWVERKSPNASVAIP